MGNDFNTHSGIMSAAPSEDGYKTDECVGYIVRAENGVVEKIIVSPNMPVEVQGEEGNMSVHDLIHQAKRASAMAAASAASAAASAASAEIARAESTQSEATASMAQAEESSKDLNSELTGGKLVVRTDFSEVEYAGKSLRFSQRDGYLHIYEGADAIGTHARGEWNHVRVVK